eukprot:c15509_g1_i2 orf=205-1350(-)
MQLGEFDTESMAMVGDQELEREVAELHMKEEERVVGIKELVDAGLHAVPPIYVRPPHERPGNTLADAALSQYRIPVIDLTHLHAQPNKDTSDAHEDSLQDGNADARGKVIEELGRACEEWGFFQEVALKFFEQPVEERVRIRTQSFHACVGYSTSFNPAVEKVREWRDTLFFSRFTGTCDGFQEAPEICKKELQEYIGGVEALAGRLYRAIFESAGLDEDDIEREVPGIPRVSMGINYFPPCPDPSLTLGLSGHSDVSCLTILYPGNVPGLQINHKGSWVPVFPIDPSAFVINLADQTEILTNGKYKSIEHRVVTNGEKPRMSIACFFGPLEDTIVAPLPKLLNENNPPHYKPTKFKDYYQNFADNRLLPGRGTIDFARLK